MAARYRLQSQPATVSLKSAGDSPSLADPSTRLTEVSSPGGHSSTEGSSSSPVAVASPARLRRWQTSVSRERLFWLGVFLIGVLLLLNGVAGLVHFVAQWQPGLFSETLDTPVDALVDCRYTWLDWDACTATCGYGTTKRRINITNQPTSNGVDCPVAAEQVEKAVCSDVPCP